LVVRRTSCVWRTPVTSSEPIAVLIREAKAQRLLSFRRFPAD
jgi:hypothetical protein